MGCIELAQNSDKQLWTSLRNLTFINRLIISCLAEQLAASNEGRYPMSLTEERVHIEFNQFLANNSETLICHLAWKHVIKSRLKNWLDNLYTGADKSLARLGRKQPIATEDFDVHISYLLS
jgi:hypothetical protein